MRPPPYSEGPWPEVYCPEHHIKLGIHMPSEPTPSRWVGTCVQCQAHRVPADWIIMADGSITRLPEDFVVCSAHAGRGRWTWYTGSTCWLYREALRVISSFRSPGKLPAPDPCISGDRPGVKITLTFRSATSYRIVVENSDGVERGVCAVTLDGRPCSAGSISLVDDGRDHEIRVRVGMEG